MDTRLVLRAVAAAVAVAGTVADAHGFGRRHHRQMSCSSGVVTACHPHVVCTEPCPPPCPVPCLPGHIVAASATIVAHIRPDAELRVDGRPVAGTGSPRVVTTATIPLGQVLVVTLQAGGNGPDDADGPPKDPNDPGPKPPDAGPPSDPKDPGPRPPGTELPPPGSVGASPGTAGGVSITKLVRVRPCAVVTVDLTKPD